MAHSLQLLVAAWLVNTRLNFRLLRQNWLVQRPRYAMPCVVCVCLCAEAQVCYALCGVCVCRGLGMLCLVWCVCVYIYMYICRSGKNKHVRSDSAFF